MALTPAVGENGGAARAFTHDNRAILLPNFNLRVIQT
jgi:hypothetical protein